MAISAPPCVAARGERLTSGVEPAPLGHHGAGEPVLRYVVAGVRGNRGAGHDPRCPVQGATATDGEVEGGGSLGVHASLYCTAHATPRHRDIACVRLRAGLAVTAVTPYQRNESLRRSVTAAATPRKAPPLTHAIGAWLTPIRTARRCLTRAAPA